MFVKLKYQFNSGLALPVRLDPPPFLLFTDQNFSMFYNFGVLPYKMDAPRNYKSKISESLVILTPPPPLQVLLYLSFHANRNDKKIQQGSQMAICRADKITCLVSCHILRELLKEPFCVKEAFYVKKPFHVKEPFCIKEPFLH